MKVFRQDALCLYKQLYANFGWDLTHQKFDLSSDTPGDQLPNCLSCPSLFLWRTSRGPKKVLFVMYNGGFLLKHFVYIGFFRLDFRLIRNRRGRKAHSLLNLEKNIQCTITYALFNKAKIRVKSRHTCANEVKHIFYTLKYILTN